MKLIFKGIVQGVGFRPTIYRIAHKLGLKGYVLNKGSEVEVVIDKDSELFIHQVKQHLPSIAKITAIERYPDDRTFDDFQIKHSKSGSRESLIPPDVATCDACRKELFEQGNRRYLFPFTNCTICGARYSLITEVPYDRERTAMRVFPLCSVCEKEYRDVEDRRYHAQTISCSKCGPQYMLFNNKKQKIFSANLIKNFAEEIDDGAIGVIKSWGGMHLCCTIDEIERFREWYHRPQKAFALMVRDISAGEQFADISHEEKKLLESNARPIVLVNKREGELVSPGLNSIGIFLPYTGLHHLLFHFLKSDALVMTSANIPGEPMMLTNEEVFSLHADWYLLHNREIPNRIDDSVIKIWGSNTFFLRKSRGFVPDPIEIPYDQQIISVGAGENICGAISSLKRLYCTQYIGNGAYYHSLEFLEQSIRHLMQLLVKKQQIAGVVQDRHPAYDTRRVAQHFADEFAAPLIDVSHHWAHAAALLVDAGIDNAVVLTLDGLGYGDDGTFWGGDVLYADFEKYIRVGHLDYLSLMGGDRATKDPRRLVFSIYPHLGEDLGFSAVEIAVMNKLMSHSPKCCSLGRYLDALACFLDICCIRTYSGEPAMKLEKYLAQGNATMNFDMERKGNVVPVLDIFHQLESQIHRPLNEQQKANVCYSVVKTIIDELVDIAVDHAVAQGVSTVGISGGVSYNIPIINMVHKRVKKAGKGFIAPHRIPNGDGCIAVGQNVIAGNKL